MADIGGALFGKFALCAVFFHDGEVLRVQAVYPAQVRHEFFQLSPRRLFSAQCEIQYAPDERQQQNGYDPRDLIFRIDVRIDDEQRDHDIDDREDYRRDLREVEHIRCSDDERGQEREFDQEQKANEQKFARQKFQ